MSATIKDVARLAGVTPAVVSRTINNDPNLSIRETTRERILKAVDELSYVPNPSAQSLRSRLTRSLGMLVPDIGNPFFTDIIKGAQESALARNVYLILINTDEVWHNEKRLIQMLINKKVDGILYLSAHMDVKAVSLIEKSQVPYVLVNRNTVNAKTSFVGLDNMKGAILAMKHLIELGHRRIAHIAGPLYTDTAIGRLQGYRTALNMNGIAYDPRYVVEAAYSYDGGKKAVTELLLLEERPTAIFAANDLIAMGAAGGANEMGIRIPEDLSLIGLNNIWVTEHFMPPLSTIAYDHYEMGKRACEILLGQIADPQREPESLILEPTLVVRKSTARL